MTTTKQKILETRKKIYEDRSFSVTFKEISEKMGFQLWVQKKYMTNLKAILL